MRNFNIGFEIHVQLNTKTKLFSSSLNSITDSNTNINPIDLGMPGTLPRLNEKAVEKAIQLAKALNCYIQLESAFDRKSYVYPDLPVGYQITQAFRPIATGGYIELQNGKIIHLDHIHLECDAASSIHVENLSLIDFNRSGVPLVEIVTKPEIESFEDAEDFVKQLLLIVEYIGVSNCNMEEGNFRIDANFSIRKENGELGVRTEIKNLNSIRFMVEALKYEYDFHLANYNTLIPSTKRFDSTEKKTFFLRSKEETSDYRYFPDANLPSLVLSENYINSITIPNLPNYYRKKWFFLNKEILYNIIQNQETALILDSIEKQQVDLQMAANLLCILYHLHPIKSNNLQEKYVEIISDCCKLLEKNKITTTIAKKFFEEGCFNKRFSEWLKENNMNVISNEEELKNHLISIFEKDPETFNRFKKGEKKLLSYFIGCLMKTTGGKANTQIATKIINDLVNQ